MIGLAIRIVGWVGAALVADAVLPDSVVINNMPEDMTPEQLDAVLNGQPASIGDGLVATGNGLALTAVAVTTIYLLNKKG